MKILVISLAGIGDTILATPLMHELRAHYPEARIDALVLWAGSKDVLQGNPHLTSICQHNLLEESKLAAWRFLRPLRGSQYDLSINTHPQSRIHYRVIARVVGAPHRLSHLYDNSRLLDRLLINRFLPHAYSKHSVENNLDLLSLLGKKPMLPQHELEIFLSPAEHDWAEQFLAQHQLEGKPRLGVHTGSGGTKNLALKRWPLDHYIELLKLLHRTRPDVAVLLFGGPQEEADQRQIQAALGPSAAVRVPSQTLRQAAALVKRCTAFLSVDTALMHLAAAVKAPNQLVIEAPTLNKTNLPYGNPFTLVPNPAIAGRNLQYYRYDGRGIQGRREELIRCMASVRVEAVYEAVARVLG